MEGIEKGRSKNVLGYGGLGEPNGSYWGSENSATVGIQTIKQLFQSEDWVFIAVDAIAHPISTIPFCVYKKEVVDGDIVYKKDMEHVVNRILEKPNQWASASELKYSLVADYCLVGNSYAWKGEAGSLYQIPAEKILFRFGKKQN